MLVASTDIVNGARRVLIYGVTGSGKTTLAARLSGITGLRWHSVDDLTWQPGWVEVPAEQQRSLIHGICQEPEWILDTAYGKWLDEPPDVGPSDGAMAGHRREPAQRALIGGPREHLVEARSAGSAGRGFDRARGGYGRADGPVDRSIQSWAPASHPPFRLARALPFVPGGSSSVWYAHHLVWQTGESR